MADVTTRTEKRCPSCGETKSLDEFAKSRRRPSGVQSYCRPCHNARVRASYAKNPDAYREYARKYSRNHPEVSRESARRATMRKLGITEADYHQMFLEQGEGCALCGAKVADARGHRLHIDHDHSTGGVRGLLCGNCNNGLGKFQDNPDLLRRAAEYLESRRG